MPSPSLSLICVFVLCCCHLTVSLAPGYIPPAPTGPHPRFLAQIPALKADWARLISDANAAKEPQASWYSYLQSHGLNDLTGGWYTHHGITMYQMTNNATYAASAWNGVYTQFITPYPSGSGLPDGVSGRGLLDVWVDHYDWLYNYISVANRTAFRQQLFNLVTTVFNGPEGQSCCNYNTYASWPLRATDTDETLHDYLSLLKIYALTGDESTYIYDRFLNNASMNCGGFVPKATSFYTENGVCSNNCYNETDLYPDMRTTIAAIYYKYTSGGAGWYPSGYMLEGIETYVVIGWASLRSAFGTDYFPEIAEGTLRIAMRWMKMMTPDFNQVYRFADDETGYNGVNSVVYQNLVTSAAATSWFMSDTRTQYIWNFVNKLVAAKPAAIARGLQYDLFFFAYGHHWNYPGTDCTAALTGGDFSWDSYGLGQFKSGLSATDSFYGYEWPPYHYFDHFTTSVGGFVHYRNGEWGAYQPVSYGAPTGDGEVTNVMKFYEFPQPQLQLLEYKGMLGVTYGSNYVYHLGSQCGNIQAYDGRYYGSSTFIQEYSRGNLFYRGVHADVILIMDRSNILDPSQMIYWTNVSYTTWSRDYSALAAKIAAKTVPRRRWQWHVTLNPTISNGARGSLTWAAANASVAPFVASTKQTVKLNTLFTATTYSVQNENSVAQAMSWDMGTDQFGYLATETLQTDTPWDATLHVMGMVDNGYSYSTNEYTASPAAAKMAVVTMPAGENQIIAIYNVLVGPTIASVDCCNGGAAPCNLGNYPCKFIKNNLNIIPKQHFFPTSTTAFSFTGVATSTSSVEVFLNDLNPASTYELWVDGVIKSTISAGSPVVGFYRVALTGLSAGSHTFCVQISGTGTCGVAVTPAPTVPVTPAPTTAAPTSKAPTQSPTQAPTSKSPTVAPTPAPTTGSPTSVAPTLAPSPGPTSAPTSKAPTPAPSASPTNNPTLAPSPAPTSFPTNNPTQAPTSFPTNNPTQAPSNAPTSNPTQAPSIAPTEVPLGTPTEAPTPPTVSPTSAPTQSPTNAPSPAPTAAPTAFPTELPTSFPTSAPTQVPSPAPTSSPTSAPTPVPLGTPTEAPTPPTANPTSAPTSAPSTTEAPTEAGAPTGSPTEQPTTTTGNPTEQPTELPTAESTPTESATQAPTTGSPSQPTTIATAEPSDAPSSAPVESNCMTLSNIQTQFNSNLAAIRGRWNSDGRMVSSMVVISLTPATYSGSSLSFQFDLQSALALTSSDIDNICQVIMDELTLDFSNAGDVACFTHSCFISKKRADTQFTVTLGGSSDSFPIWIVIVAIVGGVLLLLALALVIFAVWRHHDKHNHHEWEKY